MLEPPDLADDIIIASVRASYGIPVTALTFLPLGRDSLAWAYRAGTADGATYFLKVRKGLENHAALTVPHYLHDHGVTQVVAPVSTTTHRLWVDLDEFALMLYPFIDGATAADFGMTEQHWVTYGAALKQIHSTTLDPERKRSRGAGSGARVAVEGRME